MKLDYHTLHSEWEYHHKEALKNIDVMEKINDTFWGVIIRRKAFDEAYRLANWHNEQAIRLTDILSKLPSDA